MADCSTSAYWDAQAPGFDAEVDHGLVGEAARLAWTRLVRSAFPAKRGAAIDLGCGTGSLSLVLAHSFDRVTGVDFAPHMIAAARAKARGAANVRFAVADAFGYADSAGYDFLLARHVLWLAADPGAVLRNWRRLLAPGGAMLLVEGFWASGAGMPARTLGAVIEGLGWRWEAWDLSAQADLWGRPVGDERYAIKVD
jgi:SAM-dependent methyltransferase